METTATQQQVWDSYYSSRNTLLENKLTEIRMHVSNDLHKSFECSELMWYKEYASINLDFGRQTGSTLWHYNFLANHCYKHNIHTVSIFHNNSMKRYFDDKYGRLLLSTDNNYFFYEGESRIKERIKTTNLEYVIIDVASAYKKKELNHLINKFTEYNPSLFILL